MPLRKLHELPALLAPQERVFGLDPGTKTIGVAVSDLGRSVASPLVTVRRTKLQADLAALAAELKERPGRVFVLGLPVNMDGTEGPRCQSVRAFARSLMQAEALFGFVPEIVLWDERLSTAAVQRMMIDADVTRAKRAQAVDRAAAAYILQGVLDALRLLPPASAAQDEDDSYVS